MSSTDGQSVTGEEAIWARMLGGLDGPMNAAAAKLVLGMKLPEKDRRRAIALGQKAQKRELKPEEKAELESIQRVGMILTSLWSKARQK